MPPAEGLDPLQVAKLRRMPPEDCLRMVFELNALAQELSQAGSSEGGTAEERG